MADIFELLRSDHEDVLGMLAEFEAPLGGWHARAEAQHAERKKKVEQLVIEESKHEAAEEQYFWPTVRERLPNGDELAETAIEQEQQGKELLHKLDTMSADNIEFEQLLQTFVAQGRQHIAYEQDTVWPALMAELPDDEREALGQKFAKAKSAGPTRPHPNTPPKAGVLKTAGLGAAVADRARDAVTGRGE